MRKIGKVNREAKGKDGEGLEEKIKKVEVNKMKRTMGKRDRTRCDGGSRE